MEIGTFQKNLDLLNNQGFLLIERALDRESVDAWARALYNLYDDGQHQVDNSVGNVAFEKLLELQPREIQTTGGARECGSLSEIGAGKTVPVAQ